MANEDAVPRHINLQMLKVLDPDAYQKELDLQQAEYNKKMADSKKSQLEANQPNLGNVNYNSSQDKVLETLRNLGIDSDLYMNFLNTKKDLDAKHKDDFYNIATDTGWIGKNILGPKFNEEGAYKPLSVINPADWVPLMIRNTPAYQDRIKYINLMNQLPKTDYSGTSITGSPDKINRMSASGKELKLKTLPDVGQPPEMVESTTKADLDVLGRAIQENLNQIEATNTTGNPDFKKSLSPYYEKLKQINLFLSPNNQGGNK